MKLQPPRQIGEKNNTERENAPQAILFEMDTRHEPWLFRLSLETKALMRFNDIHYDIDCDECAYATHIVAHGIPQVLHLLNRDDAWCHCCEDCRVSAQFKYLEPESVSFRIYHRIENDTVEVAMRQCQFKPRYPERRKRVVPLSWQQKIKEFKIRPTDAIQRAIMQIVENKETRIALYDLVTAEMGIVCIIMEYFVPVTVQPALIYS